MQIASTMVQLLTFLLHVAGMNYSRKLLPPMVSSAIALVAVTNFCIVHIIATPGASAEQLLQSVLPMALPASVAVILVMSTLYRTLQDVLKQLDKRQRELETKSQQDALTGLASRELFEERLSQSLMRFRRDGEKFAVAMLDLDHFKRVNDLHGHQAGDELLKRAAARLSAQLRECDTIARFGGDEFLVLQTGVKGAAGIRRLCVRICEELRKPYDIGSLHLHLPASIGAVISSKHLESPSDYIRAADVALYDAKASGRNCFRFFSDELDDRLKRRDQLETDLRVALQTGTQIAVHYQPQLSAAGVVTGVEALLRWTHPTLGNIPATEVIEIAEEMDLIGVLGEYVFRQAAEFARQHPFLSVAVNISPAQFARSSGLALRMAQLAAQAGVSPSQIELEITERLFMTAEHRAELQIQSLRDCGFRVALDDFGTGYASLNCLRRFKLDRLKLDKSLATSDNIEENIAVIRGAVSLAHLLNLEVTAEGIETELQERVALEGGCDTLQGHRYGTPMSSDQFDMFLKEQMRDVA